MPEAVIFDLDGLLLDSEQVWSECKRRLTHERGGTWTDEAESGMLGMSAPEWTEYMRKELGVPLPAEEISAEVVRLMGEAYRYELPLLPGAGAAVGRIADAWRLGLASSSNREIIDLVLGTTGWRDRFAASVASEEVAAGKPAPDVYLEAARRLAVDPGRCVAVEDSSPGIRSAKAAGIAVVAIPNLEYPPDPEVLEQADVVLESLAALDAAAIERASERP
jgi:HAD superfamily hydrolase (TIGR01509 family)